jgi:hypothetical protein
MALPLAPILRALPGILSTAGEILASIRQRRDAGAAMKNEERLAKLEDDLLKAGTVLADLTRQVQGIAEELRAHERRARLIVATSAAAVACSIAAVIVVVVVHS